MVFAAARRQVGDRAEDVASETVLALLRKDSLPESESDLVRYSFGIARNLCLKVLRGDRRLSNSPVDESHRDSSPGVLTQLERLQSVRLFEEAAQTLEDRCRKLIRLRLEGKSTTDILELLDANTVNTVYTWESRCYQSLREKLGVKKHRPRGTVK